MFYWKHQILLNNKYDPSIKEKSNKQTDKKKNEWEQINHKNPTEHTKF